jgi:hypothetical protein
MQLAHFATACDQYSTELTNFLSDLLDDLSDDEDAGVEPYQVPRRLIDPKFRRSIFWASTSFLTFFFRTGDLLLDPVLPDNAPNSCTFVNEESKDYFEAQAVWPTGFFTLSNCHFSNVTEVREAVADWVRAFAVFLFRFECSWTEVNFVQDFREGPSSCEGRSLLEG